MYSSKKIQVDFNCDCTTLTHNLQKIGIIYNKSSFTQAQNIFSLQRSCVFPQSFTTYFKRSCKFFVNSYIGEHLLLLKMMYFLFADQKKVPENLYIYLAFLLTMYCWILLFKSNLIVSVSLEIGIYLQLLHLFLY